jgi:LL-diaminopimelate aminotransferase
MTSFVPAKRITDLPPYLFAELDKRVSAKRAEGADVISFGIGDPDFPTPPHIVEALRDAAGDPENHHYPSYVGLPELRNTIAEWMGKRFDVSLDPDTEVLPLWGSKEGVVHLPWAVVGPGDVVLCADPGYPVYDTGTRLAGATPVPLPLRRSNGFLPDYSDIDPADAERAKLLWLNYPGNPTGATCEIDVFEKGVEFCRANNILLAHDAAYSEITFDGYVAPSVLQVDGAKDVAVELHSFSKTFNMTGWRIGWACGCAEAIEALGRLKTNLDSGVFNAIQRAGIEGLTGPRDFLDEQLDIFARRRDTAVEALRSAGLDVTSPKGSFYLWVPVPDGYTSTSFAAKLLDEVAVVVAPGSGYGEHGEGFVRFSLTLDDARVAEGAERIATLKL